MHPNMQALDVSQEDILAGVVLVLEHFITESDKIPLHKLKPTDFDQDDIGVSISVFLDHIAKSGLCSKECFVIALVYVERLLQKHSGFVISRKNVHRLMLVSLILASKILDDFYCRNMYYATVGGITMEKLNALELNMCCLMSFEFNISVTDFELYRDSLRRDVVKQHHAQQAHAHHAQQAHAHAGIMQILEMESMNPPGILVLGFEPWSTGCCASQIQPAISPIVYAQPPLHPVYPASSTANGLYSANHGKVRYEDWRAPGAGKQRHYKQRHHSTTHCSNNVWQNVNVHTSVMMVPTTDQNPYLPAYQTWHGHRA